MALKQDLEETYTSEKEVTPGWTFCKSNKKYYPNDKAFKIDTSTCIKYNIIILSGKQLENRKQYYPGYSFSKDLSRINCSNALFVKGIKIMEIKGANITAHDLMHTVVAVNHKCFADMLLSFTNKIEDDVKNLIQESLLKILYENSECIFSDEVLKTFNCAIIYEKLFSTGVKISDFEESLTKFCHLLQNSCVSKLPMTMLLGKPNQLISSRPLNSGQNINRNSDSSITTNVSHEKDLTGKSSDQQRSLYKRSVSPEESVVQQGLQKLVRNSGTCQPHPPHINVQEKHVVSSGQRQQLSTSGNDTHPAQPHHRDVQEVHIVTKGHGQQALTSSNDTHPAHPHYRNVQNEHTVTKGQEQQALTSNNGTHPAHPQHRDIQEEHIVTKEQGYHTIPSSSGICQTDYDHADVQRQPLILSGQEHHTFAYIGDPCQAHNLHRDVQESLVCLQKENQTIACGNDSCLGHCPQRAAQEKLICPKRSSNCGKTILPEVTSPSNPSCSEAQVNESCYRTSQNIDCSEYIMKESDMSVSQKGKTESQNIMKDSDMSVSQKGKTDSQNIMKDSDMSVSKKGKTDSQNMKDSHLSLSKKGKTDSQNVTKDSDVTISIKGKNNNRNLHEANGRSQKMANSIKKGNSETKDNSRSLSAQNQKDDSTLTDRKENTSSKNIKPHIINPVKSQKDPSGMERKFYGNSISNLKEKVVILLGASGSGKTTLVNFIANYFQGAKVADDMLAYVDANSSRAKPTTTITAYTFCTDENHAPITVIDTPGLNDSSRKEVDDNIQLIKQFLANAASHKIDIHAIGFVVQAHLVRLTSSERLILDYISSLFGQSVAHHLIMFVTAADNQEIPPVVEAMRNCNIKSKTFFKFNNSATNNKVQEIDEFDRLYWRMGYKSWKKCLKLLLDLPQLSVNTFKALQNKVYSGKVIESAARDLKEELNNFVHLCKDHKYLTKEAFEKCEQVWELAVVFNHLVCTQESGVSNVESILQVFAIEVCMGNSFNSNECIDLLFLVRSKSLLAAGMGVISSMGPLYENAKKYIPKHDDKQVPSILHCARCKDDHQITREVYSGLMSYIPGLGKSREIITFKCTKCDCDGSLHKDMAGGKLLASFDLSSQLLLRNTKTVITKLLQKRHFSGCTINQDKYLHLINIALDYKYKIFIEELLKS